MPTSNQVRIGAAFIHSVGEDVVPQILRGFEEAVIAFTEDTEQAELELSPRTATFANGQANASYALDEDDEDTDEDAGNLDELLVSDIRAAVAKYLEVDLSYVSSGASFISLGLDSVKSIGLSRALKGVGVNVSAVDLMKYSSIRRLRKYIAGNQRQPMVNGTAGGLITSSVSKALRREVVDKVDAHDFRLSDDDHVDLYPTTDLQSGMLSMVRAFHDHITVSNRLLLFFSDGQFSWKCLYPRLPVLSFGFRGPRQTSCGLVGNRARYFYTSHIVPLCRRLGQVGSGRALRSGLQVV